MQDAESSASIVLNNPGRRLEAFGRRGLPHPNPVASSSVVEAWELMHFEKRELKLHAEPVSPAAVEVAATYFSVQFIDDEMLVPELEALVFIGRDLAPEDQGILYFQDAGSYRAGIRFESAEAGNAVFYAQSDNEINHIFEYERHLMFC